MDDVVALEVPTGSAIEPWVDGIAWSVRRLVGVNHVHHGDGSIDRARSVFQFPAEQLHVAGAGSVAIQVSSRPGSSPSVEVFAAFAVLGRGDAIIEEADVVAGLLDAQLGRPGLPFDVERTSFADMTSALGDVNDTVIVRQRVVDVDDGAGGDVRVLMRFNPTTDPWIPLLNLLQSYPYPVSVRVTVLPTDVTVSDRSGMTESLRAAARMRSAFDDHAELVTPAHRALATMSDVAASFTSPVFCGELAITSDRHIPTRLARSIAACFTSDSEVLRRTTGTVVAGQTVMLGGFELERNVPGHADALTCGLPLRGGLAERDLRDLWTLTEAPLSWPVPIGAPAPGLPASTRRALPAPAALVEEPDCGGMLLGQDPSGLPVWLHDEPSRRHVAVWGRTGVGKTSLMVDWIRDECEQRRPFVLVDPHTDAGRRALRTAQRCGLEPVVIDLGDSETDQIRWTPGLRADGSNASEAEAAVRLFVDQCVAHLDEDWKGPRFVQGATAFMSAVSAYGCDLQRGVEMLASADGVSELVEHPHLEPWVRSHLEAFHSRTSTDGASVRDWIVSKFSTFFAGPARHLLAVPGTGVHLGEAILDGRPVIVNLAGLADVDARVLGQLALAQVASSLMGRGAVPPGEAPVRVFVDEAPRFYTTQIESLMTGGRKFGVSLVLLAQAPNQFGGVLGDQALAAETQIVFAQTPGGASILSEVLQLSPRELIGQPDFHAYVKSGQHEVVSIEGAQYPSADNGSNGRTAIGRERPDRPHEP